MSVSSRPYKSRLFNFLNRQSLQLRDRLGETFRHLKVAAEWSAQILISPFYWLLHPQQWNGPTLGAGASNSNPNVLPSSVADTDPSYPPVDQPLEKILTTIEPWFEIPELPSSPKTLSSEEKSAKKQIILSHQFFEQIQQHLEASLQANVAEQSTLEFQKPLPKLGFSQLTTPIKNLFANDKPKDLIIQGLACALDTRQLVLTTTDNDVLDVLSPEQQQTLQQALRSELANYWYERRLQWSISQKTLGLIPLVDAKNDTVLPPVQWLWKTLHWLETQEFKPQLPPWKPSTLVPVSASALVPGKKLLDNLDQRVSSLENQEIQWRQQIFQQVQQGLQRVQASPLVESALEKTGELAQYIEIPPALQRFNTEVLAKVSWPQLTPANLPHLFSPSEPTEASNLPIRSQALESREPDPFQIQVLIQAAIAYFFGQQARSSQFAKPAQNKLNGSTEKIEDPWLTWEDLFIDVTTEAAPVTSTENTNPLPLQGIPRQKKLNSSKSHKIQKKSRQSPPIRRPVSPSPAHSVTNAPTSTNHTLTIPKPEEMWEDEIAIALTPTQTFNTDLEATPDWIETEAKPIGYIKHPLERILEWLDVGILWLEENLKKLWYWFKQHSPLKN
ncbi:MAG: hypothetical protein VKJ02_13475 [Snowella sp.]|nr:hypothetical protein [Snowella sp.]